MRVMDWAGDEGYQLNGEKCGAKRRTPLYAENLFNYTGFPVAIG